VIVLGSTQDCVDDTRSSDLGGMIPDKTIGWVITLIIIALLDDINVMFI